MRWLCYGAQCNGSYSNIRRFGTALALCAESLCRLIYRFSFEGHCNAVPKSFD
jgi:hypothetical protein